MRDVDQNTGFSSRFRISLRFGQGRNPPRGECLRNAGHGSWKIERLGLAENSRGHCRRDARLRI